MAKVLQVMGNLVKKITHNLDMTSHRITNLAAPVDGTDAANKQYIDENALLKTGGTMTGAVTLNGVKLTEGVDYGPEVPADLEKGRIFWVEVTK